MIQAKNLSKQFNGTKALDDINFSVEKGQIFCLLGQNGAGKTTTINIFLGFLDATSGEARINDRIVKPDDHETKRMVAYIPEVVQLYGNLTGVENLDFFSRLAGFRYTEAILRDCLDQVELQRDAQKKRLAEYSKGMRQKVGIAIALAKKADVIFMDEPTSGLDPKATKEFTRVCKQFVAGGKSIFMATHDIFNAVDVGTRIGIMRQGQLVHELTTSGTTATQLQQLYLETI